uniref:SHSP domain-containing protein n=1 Tax=Meloidogyne javanica TaxID=6303 RepID=A0A915MBY2_MELJA
MKKTNIKNKEENEIEDNNEVWHEFYYAIDLTQPGILGKHPSEIDKSVGNKEGGGEEEENNNKLNEETSKPINKDIIFEKKDENFQMRDHAAQMKIEPNGDFTYKVDVSGFRPEELNVEIEGNEVVVTGEHFNKQNEGETVHRQFTRRVYIPEGIKKETFKCGFDINGRSIYITAKQTVEGKRSIPIDFNPVNKIKDTETNTK